MKWVSGIGVHGSNPQLRMSALGHKRTFSEVFVMSALPPKADIGGRELDVRFTPKADISSVLKMSRLGQVLPDFRQ
jgi:hypothetical protein